MLPLTLGTAGHIDHGKTALVEALTGKNTDRLAEERRRGISIELGYAELELPGGRSLSVVDVPGHEALVRTMVAGATGIDLFLMVIAADEGVMPQTREHLTVLQALGVAVGVVALSRSDLAAPGQRERAAADVRQLIDAPLVEVSARTRQGLDQLRRALAEAADRAEAGREDSPWDEPAVLHVDRVFTLRGIGTVVTGTLWSGELRSRERVEVQPDRSELRIRSIQVHDRPVDSARAGQRVALNLAGTERDRLARGQVVCSPGADLGGSYRLDVELQGPLELGEGERRVQVHHGTRRSAARVVPLGDGLAQLRLESPLIARGGDRFVLRRVAPPGTLGGGVVIDPLPARHGPGPATSRLRAMASAPPVDLLALALEDAAAAGDGAGVPVDPAQWGAHPLLGPARRRWHPDQCSDAVRALVESGAAVERGDLLVRAGSEEPAPPEPAPPEPDALAVRTLELIASDGASPRSAAALAEQLGCDRGRAEASLQALVAAGRAVRVKPGIYYESEELERIDARLLTAAADAGEITLAEAKRLLGTSRKYAQALLEHLDANHLTVRHGDRHVVRRAARGELAT